VIFLAIALAFLIAVAAIGAVTLFIGSWVFPAIVGAVLIVVLIRAKEPTIREAAIAFIPMFVFGVFVAMVDPGNRSPEFYGAAAQVLPVLFLAAVFDAKALSANPFHRLIALQVLLYLVVGEYTSLISLLENAESSRAPPNLVTASVMAGFVSIVLLVHSNRQVDRQNDHAPRSQSPR
jgi:surface polysaccharide O-acyltransferase-like enzyme